ncbi:DNA-binding protein [candidate division KSB1 bacterium]|nr:DNA-binding protein [candidate division KSB1 bacterium]
MKDLTQSKIHRQNILNNGYAVEEIQKAADIKGIFWQDEYWVTRQQAAEFFEVDERTISRYLESFEPELTTNGYTVLRGKALKSFILSCHNSDVTDIHVPKNTPALGVFNFRAFLNLAMLLAESEKARILRSIILDITIDTINKKTGGGTKYINQRDEDFITSYFRGEHYRIEFTDALRDCVDMGNAKYAIYTNKIYRSIFKENAEEYRQILKLKSSERVRDTMYSEILDLISMYESGFAEELQKRCKRMGRKLFPIEVDELFDIFESHALWKPTREKARSKMASRDLGFREALHENLKEYIDAIKPEDFERFLGEKSKALQDRLEENKDVFKRLKERK